MTKTQKIYKAITKNKNGLSTAAIRERSANVRARNNK